MHCASLWRRQCPSMRQAWGLELHSHTHTHTRTHVKTISTFPSSSTSQPAGQPANLAVSIETLVSECGGAAPSGCACGCQPHAPYRAKQVLRISVSACVRACVYVRVYACSRKRCRGVLVVVASKYERSQDPNKSRSRSVRSIDERTNSLFVLCVARPPRPRRRRKQIVRPLRLLEQGPVPSVRQHDSMPLPSFGVLHHNEKSSSHRHHLVHHLYHLYNKLMTV